MSVSALRKAAIILISSIICFSPAPANVHAGGLEPISAEAAVLLDWHSGRVLYEQNPHLPRPMASITKIMTAILGLEMGSMEDIVTISSRAAQTGGSSIWLEEGEKKTLEELLYGLMLRSGNDAAVAIAEHIAGSEGAFAAIMTSRARELGARNTSFCNPHGLHHAEHYTTAYDFSLIAAHAMGIAKFRKIISTDHITISWPGQPWERCLYNQNKLLELYPGAEGIKTGWTTPAGRCFVGAATREGRRLIAVVLNAPAMWEDTIKLLDFGFDCFSYRPLINEGQRLKTVPVLHGQQEKVMLAAARTFAFPMQAEEERKISYQFVINEPLYAPLKNGERIGELQIYFEGNLIGLVDLLADREIKKLTPWQRLRNIFRKEI